MAPQLKVNEAKNVSIGVLTLKPPIWNCCLFGSIVTGPQEEQLEAARMIEGSCRYDETVATAKSCPCMHKEAWAILHNCA